MSVNVSLGLNVPDRLPVGNFPLFEDRNPILKDSEIRELAEGPKLFEDASWLSNQNPYNSCCAHAFNHAVERQAFRHFGKRVECQPHFLYAHINGGQDQGALLVDGARMLMTVGVPLKSDAPDDRRIYLTQYPNREELVKKSIKGLELFEVRSKEALLSALALRFSVVVAVHVDNAFVQRPNLPPVNSGVGNHAICLDDYEWNAQIGDYVLRNPGSWGSGIGINGVWQLTWNHLRIPNNYHVFYAVPSVTGVESSTPVAKE